MTTFSLSQAQAKDFIKFLFNYGFVHPECSILNSKEVPQYDGIHVMPANLITATYKNNVSDSDVEEIAVENAMFIAGTNKADTHRITVAMLENGGDKKFVLVNFIGGATSIKERQFFENLETQLGFQVA